MSANLELLFLLNLLLAWRMCSPLWQAVKAVPPNRAAFRPSHWLSPLALPCSEEPSLVGLLSFFPFFFFNISREIIGLKLMFLFLIRFYFEAAHLWCPSWHHLLWGQHLLGGESETSNPFAGKLLFNSLKGVFKSKKTTTIKKAVLCIYLKEERKNRAKKTANSN